MTAPNFADDIPLELATRAHAGTSHSPERRGEQEREGYASQLQHDLEKLAELADTDEKRFTLAAEFETYREGYRRRVLLVLGAKARCMSTLVTGRSNFPGARNQKRSDAADKATQAALEFRAKALAGIRRQLRPELEPIKSSDPDAVARLREQAADLEKAQERMKAANAVIRTHRGDEARQILELVKLGHPAALARQILKPDELGRVGFPAYMLTNNNANLKRIQERIEKVGSAQGQPDVSIDGIHGRFEESPSDNRVRVYFKREQDAMARAELKRSGFRWTPSLGCYQAFRNPRAIVYARRFAGVE